MTYTRVGQGTTANVTATLDTSRIEAHLEALNYTLGRSVSRETTHAPPVVYVTPNLDLDWKPLKDALVGLQGPSVHLAPITVHNDVKTPSVQVDVHVDMTLVSIAAWIAAFSVMTMAFVNIYAFYR